MVTVHGSSPLALLQGGQVPFSAASSLGKLAIIEPKKVPDPVLRERLPGMIVVFHSVTVAIGSSFRGAKGDNSAPPPLR